MKNLILIREALATTNHQWEKTYQPDSNHPPQHYPLNDPGSTTQKLLQANVELNIIPIPPPPNLTAHEINNFFPQTSRASAMTVEKNLFILAYSWLEAPSNSKVYKHFECLAQQSLGTILFAPNQPWQRSPFEYIKCSYTLPNQNSKTIFGRRSSFINQHDHHLHLVEYFFPHPLHKIPSPMNDQTH